MFRIHIKRGSESTALTVEGKLIGLWVTELEKCWRAAASAESEGPISVDLTSVYFIDESGKQLLTRMHEQGTTFLAAGLMAKFLIEEIKCAESTSTCGMKAPTSASVTDKPS